jgi:hypothetical protein
MSSILKVDTIQTTAGAAPFITSLGMKAQYFGVTLGDTTVSASTTTTYDMSSLIGTGATLSNDLLTVTEAGDYLLQFYVGCAYTGSGNSRYQENYLHVNSTKIIDSRDNVTNIDGNYEYYTCTGHRIYTLAANDVLKVSGNGQGNYIVRSAYGSNLFGIKLS